MTLATNDTAREDHEPRKVFPRPPTTLLRRVPRQERGKERVEKILDAAAVVIAEVGVDAMTTNAIAVRANTSVGSLYQFFPNKEAIVEALAARYNAELRRINEEALSAEAATLPLREVVEQVIAPLRRFYEENPAYRHVYHAMNGPTGPSCGEAELHKAVVARLESLMEARAPKSSRSTRHVRATVAVLAGHALLGFAMTASSAMREAIVRELMALITAYVDGVMEGYPASPRQSLVLEERVAHTLPPRVLRETGGDMGIDNGAPPA